MPIPIGPLNGIVPRNRFNLPARQQAACNPPPPLQVENPGNPSSWYKGFTDLISGALRWVSCTQSKITKSILGDPNEDPNMLRHSLFQAMALIGFGYTRLPAVIQQQEEIKKANKDTFPLALRA